MFNLNNLDMKKFLVTLFCIFAISSVSAQRNIFQHNHTFDINLGYNSSGGFIPIVNDKVSGVSSMQLSLSCHGVYLDGAFNIQGDHTSNVGVDQYAGYQTYACHVGYSFPVCKWAKIIPVIGVSSWAEGYYDGSDWSVINNGIVNRFHKNYGYTAFDYGVVLNFTIAKFLNVYLNVEAHNIGGGVGVSFQYETKKKH